jgi:Tfp pilus assembly protein PilX
MLMKYKEKDGVVSLVVTLFIMLIVSLVALSFATLMRREQRQALDRQLGSQAFYAAETGINDAMKALEQNPSAVGEINSCSNADQAKILVDGVQPNRVLDATSNVAYTCVFVDQTPTELEYSVGRDDTKVIPLNTTSSTFSSVRVYWQDETSLSSFAPYNAAQGNFPPLSQWGANLPGILKIQLIPATMPLNKADVANETIDFYAFPSTGSSNTFTIGTSPSGSVIEGNCKSNPAAFNMALQCEVIISGLNDPKYVMVVRGIYDSSKVIVRGYTSAAPAVAAPISGAQVVIDSTGKAQDVVKRVKVNAPIRPDMPYPNFALQVGDDICKRLRVTPQETDVDSITIDGASLVGDPSCDPATPN